MSESIGPKFVDQNKKYGLIIPNKTSAAPKPTRLRPSVFNADEDDDINYTSGDKRNINTNETRIKKQTQINIEKALEEDPNIFEYDKIYEKIDEDKSKNDPKLKNQSKEPKYITGLMKAAAVRQMEYERRQERKIQKERLLEGDIFEEKEVFVTSTYRKRLEERKLIEEEEHKQDQIEALLDVTKQKDLRGFYESLLKMKTGEMVIEEEGEKEKRLEREKIEKEEKLKNEQKFSKKSKTIKSIRTRKEDVSSEEEENEIEIDTKHKIDSEIQNTVNLDKDEVLSDQSEDEKENEGQDPPSKKPKINENPVPEIEDKKDLKPIKKLETKEEKWKRLFTKRTVGKIFDQELAEYYQRKNNILSLKLYIEKD